MEKRRQIFLLLLVIIGVASALVGVLISRNGGKRGRQLAQQAVTGRPVGFTRETCAPGCTYLPVVAANTGPARHANTDAPLAGIIVMAQASPACQAEAAMPVAGARVSVVTARDTRFDVTDASGYLVFEPAGEAAVVQIEWPAGFLPCPNSRPWVELPEGAGEAEFMASPAAYPGRP